MTLGERIYSLRTERRLSQDDLAEVLEVSRQSVSKWETDASVPELDKLVKLSEYFGLTLDELVKGGESTRPQPESEPEVPAAPSEPVIGMKLELEGRVRIALGSVLLVVSLVGILLWGLEGALLLLPVVLAGVGCFVFKRHTALWCCWLAWLGGAVLWPWATGVGWLRVLLSLGRVPADLTGILSWAQLLTLVVLAVLTLRLLLKKMKKP